MIRSFSLLVLISLCSFPACYAAVDNSRTPLDGIAAVVGDEPILLSELEAYILLRLNAIKPDKDSADYAAMREQFLQELIDGKVLLVHAKKDTTLSVKSEEVDQALDMHVQRIMAENRLSQEDFEKELAKQGLSLAKARAQWRKGIQEQLLKQKLQQSQMSGFDVTQKEVQQFYDQYKDSLPAYGESVRLLKLSIEVLPSDSVRQAAYDKITHIKTRLNNGESFEELAKQFSEDPSASSGGDLGFIAKGTLNELVFEEKAFSLKPGEISDPFQTRMGFHIIKVEGKKEQMVHIRHIFVAVAPTQAIIAATQARLDSIRSACTTREAFAAAVKRFSTDRLSKSRDGDIGWMAVEGLPAEYKSAFDTLAEGSISKPVKVGEMFMLFMISKKVDSRPLTLEDDWGILAEKAKDIYSQKRLIDLVKRWRQEIYIDIRI
jgi:peptidyl-prolyl cis-trans isomerase SurA